MDAAGLSPGVARETLNALLKYEDDVLRVTEKLDGLIAPPGGGKTESSEKTRAAAAATKKDCGTDLSRFDF